jgi:hypothetical protein
MVMTVSILYQSIKLSITVFPASHLFLIEASLSEYAPARSSLHDAERSIRRFACSIPHHEKNKTDPTLRIVESV